MFVIEVWFELKWSVVVTEDAFDMSLSDEPLAPSRD